MTTESPGPTALRSDKAWRAGDPSPATADDHADREMRKYGTPTEYIAGRVEIDGRAFLVRPAGLHPKPGKPHPAGCCTALS